MFKKTKLFTFLFTSTLAISPVIAEISTPYEHTSIATVSNEKKSLAEQALQAAREGDHVAMRALCEQGLDPNSVRDDKDASLLMLAAKFGHIEVVKTLLNYGLY